MKKISIIIAAYNIEKYIKRCLDSVVNQTYKSIEIIIVNDGSTDKTLSILENYKKEDSRIIIINQENRGLSEARKTGYRNATGDYLLFIDGDDWLEEDAISILYKIILRDNSDIICFNAFKSSDIDSKFMCIHNLDSKVTNDYLKEVLLNNFLPAIWSKLIKKEYIDSLPVALSSNFTYGEDLASITLWFLENPKVSVIDNALYHYYQRYDSITKVNNNKVFEINEVICFIKEQLLHRDLYTKYKDSFEFMVFMHLFIYKIINVSSHSSIQSKVYNQFKEYEIKKNNVYICCYIKNVSYGKRIRIKLYLRNYYLGYLFDIALYPIKKLLLARLK